MQNETTTNTLEVKEPTKLELAVEKLQALLTSRKFWSLIGSLVTIGTAMYNGSIDPATGVWAVVGAFGAYSVSTGIEDASKWNSAGPTFITSNLIPTMPDIPDHK